jgi:hypothetical protein
MEGGPDDVPDERIWHHPERLEEWFEAVKQRQQHGFESVPGADEEPGMTGNALVRDLIGDPG